MMNLSGIKALDVPESFYKNRPFQVNKCDLRTFLEHMVGYIDCNGEVELGEIDIDGTIRNHSGDCRIWYKDSGYSTLDAVKLLMRCDEAYMYDDIYDWMQVFTPELYAKHNDDTTTI